MTAARDHRDFLEDLVSACRSIIGFVAGMTFDAYLAVVYHQAANGLAHRDRAPNIAFVAALGRSGIGGTVDACVEEAA